MSAIYTGRGRGEGRVDFEEVPRPEIKCRQYLSSMEKFTHVLSDPVLSTPDMMRHFSYHLHLVHT